MIFVLLVIAASLVLGLVPIFSSQPEFVTTLSNGVLLVLGPGFPLSVILFPGRLSALDRLAVALPLSIACVVLVTLSVQAVGVPINGASLASALYFVVAVLLIAAGTRLVMSIVRNRSRLVPRPHRIRAPDLLLGVAVVAVAVSGLAVVGYTAIRPPGVQLFTEFSLLRDDPIRVEVHNLEGHQVTYRIVVRADKQGVIREVFGTVEDGTRWVTDIRLPPGESLDQWRRVTLELHSPASTDPYRVLHTWVGPHDP